MASKNTTETDLYGTSFSIESIKVIAESIGIGNLPDDAAKELADDVSFRIKHIVQDAAKFMHHAKRTKLMNQDVDAALKIKNLEVGVWRHNLTFLESLRFVATIRLPFQRSASVSIRLRRRS